MFYYEYDRLVVYLINYMSPVYSTHYFKIYKIDSPVEKEKKGTKNAIPFLEKDVLLSSNYKNKKMGQF